MLQAETRPLGDISCIHEVRKLMANGTSTRERRFYGGFCASRMKLLNHSCVTSALFVLAREENIRNENSESAFAQPNKTPRAIDERRANNISYNHRELGDAQTTATR